MAKKREQIGMAKAKLWLESEGYEVISKDDKTYIGFDIMATKNGKKLRVEVKYRSYPNLGKQWVDITEDELDTADMMLIVVHGKKPERKFLGIIPIDLRVKESYRITEVKKYRIHSKKIPKTEALAQNRLCTS